MVNGKERKLIKITDTFNVNGLVVVPVYALWIGLRTKLIQFRDNVTFASVKEAGSLQEKKLMELMLETQSLDFSDLTQRYGEFTCYDVNTKQWKDIDLEKGMIRCSVTVGTLPLGTLTNDWHLLREPTSISDYQEYIAYINERLDIWGNKLKDVIEWSEAATQVPNVYLSNGIDIHNNFSYNPGA